MNTRSDTIRLTVARALVRRLLAQQIIVGGRKQTLFGGVFANRGRARQRLGV